MPLVNDLWSSIPPITRSILMMSVLLTVAVSLDICTPFKLYFNYKKIKTKFEVIITQFIYIFLVLEIIYKFILLWRIHY